MTKKLNSKEIERLKQITIAEKIEQRDWYQYGNEKALQEIVKKSSRKIQQINDLSKKNPQKAKEKLQKFLPHLSKSTEIYFPISAIEYPERFYIGEGSFVNLNLQIISAGKVQIGSHCFIGPNCQFFTPNHHSSDLHLRREGWQYDSPITIVDDCWLGGSVILLPGVTIGDDVVIGAGSVVTKNFPSHCVIAGNPARIIKSQHLL